METLSDRLKQVRTYGLEVEVIYEALKIMQENSEKSIGIAYAEACFEYDI
jgi:hypothetical protein